MWLRANVTLAIAVVFAVVQMFASATGGPRAAESSAQATTPNSGFTRSVAAQDDNDDEDEDNDDEDDSDNDDEDDDNEDNEDNDDADDDNDEDNDKNDEDNDDADDDNEDDEDNDDEDDSDNDDGDSDNDEDDELDDELDNIEPDTARAAAAPTIAPTTGAAAAPTAPAVSASPVAVPPATEAQLVTSGVDATLALGTDRIAVQVFSTMPAGVTLTVKIVDPLSYPATPGIRAGNLIFALEATDSMGVVLPTLPGEVNLSVRYTEVDVVGLDKALVTLGRLDPVSSTWNTAPKLVTDPMTNYLAASVMDTGVYAVYTP